MQPTSDVEQHSAFFVTWRCLSCRRLLQQVLQTFAPRLRSALKLHCQLQACCSSLLHSLALFSCLRLCNYCIAGTELIRSLAWHPTTQWLIVIAIRHRMLACHFAPDQEDIEEEVDVDPSADIDQPGALSLPVEAGGPITSLAMSADGHLLAIGAHDGQVSSHQPQASSLKPSCMCMCKSCMLSHCACVPGVDLLRLSQRLQHAVLLKTSAILLLTWAHQTICRADDLP